MSKIPVSVSVGHYADQLLLLTHFEERSDLDSNKGIPTLNPIHVCFKKFIERQSKRSESQKISLP